MNYGYRQQLVKSSVAFPPFRRLGKLIGKNILPLPYRLLDVLISNFIQSSIYRIYKQTKSGLDNLLLMFIQNTYILLSSFYFL